MQRRDDFLAEVSNDLRIPLASIVMNADAIAFHAPSVGSSGARVHACAAEIVAACEHMQQLVEELLDVTATDTGPARVHPVRSEVGRGSEFRFTLPGA